MTFSSKFQFTTDLNEKEKDYIADCLATRMHKFFQQERDTVAQIASKFHMDGKEVSIFATAYRNDMDEVVVIGIETANLETAKYLQNEFHESMREYADAGSEFSHTWINPEIN